MTTRNRENTIRFDPPVDAQGSRFRRRVGAVGGIQASPVDQDRGGRYQGRPLRRPTKKEETAPQGESKQGEKKDKLRDTGPATMPASGNVGNQRQNLFTRMKTESDPDKIEAYRKEANSLGVTESGFIKALGTIKRQREQSQFLQKPNSGAAQATTAIKSKADQDAENQRIIAGGAAATKAELARNEGRTTADNAGNVSMAAAVASAEEGKKDAAKSPQQIESDKAYAQQAAIRQRYRDQGNDLRPDETLTQEDKRRIAQDSKARAIARRAGTPIDKGLKTPSRFRDRALNIPEGNVLVDKGGKAPAGMEMVGMRSGGRMLYAPVKEVYGAEPTGAGTRVMNSVKNATGIGTPKAVQTIDTIRGNYQIQNQDRALKSAPTSYSPRMQKGGQFQAVGNAPTETVPQSALRNRPNPAPAAAKPSHPMDRYSSDVYKRTDAARAKGFRRQAAEQAVRTGGADAMNAGQRKEFGKMYADTKLYEGAGMTTHTAPKPAAQPGQASSFRKRKPLGGSRSRR